MCRNISRCKAPNIVFTYLAMTNGEPNGGSDWAVARDALVAEIELEVCATREYLGKAGFNTIETNQLAHDIQNNWYVIRK